MPRRLGFLALGVVAISCAAVLIRLADAPPLAVAVFRMGIASAALLPCALIRARRELRALLHERWPSLTAAGLLLALHFALWIASLSQTSVTSSVVLVTTTPLFVALASWVLFRERLRRATFAGISISLGGALLIGYAGIVKGGAALSGNFMALGAALAMVGYLLIGGRVRLRAGLLAYATIVFTVAACALLIAAAVSGVSLSGYSTGTYVAVVALALVPQLVGHMSLNWALRFLPATMVTVAVLGEPVGASFLAWVMLGEAPTVLELVGGAFILAGIALAFVWGGAPAGFAVRSAPPDQRST